MGSIREDQSLCEGGMSIHSSRLGFTGDWSEGRDGSVGDSGRRDWCVDLGGSAGPKSSSSSLSSEGESFGFGGEEGRSESGAGGREGPRTRGGLGLSWSWSSSPPPLLGLDFWRSFLDAIWSDVDDSGREGPKIRRRLGLSDEVETELDRDRCGLGCGRLFGDLSWTEAWSSASSSRFLFASRWGGSSGPAVAICNVLFLLFPFKICVNEKFAHEFRRQGRF